MKKIINGFEMAWDDRGKGPAVLLIHGFPLCRRMWEGQAAVLAAAGYRVITPDLRGFGESEATAGGYDMENLADDIAALMDHLGVRKAAVGGMSMGGYVLLSLLERYRARLAAALFIVTRGVADDEAGRKKRTLLAEEVQQGRPEAVSAAFAHILFAPATKTERPDIVHAVTGWMERTNPKALIGGLIGMRERKDFIPLLGRFDLPALVIGGGEDRTIPPENSEALARGLPQSTLVVLPAAGHMANLEAPEAFNDALLRFLEGIDL